MIRLDFELDGMGWKQKRLAEETGISPKRISAIMRGYEHAWPSQRKRIARAIGWSTDRADALFEEVHLDE